MYAYKKGVYAYQKRVYADWKGVYAERFPIYNRWRSSTIGSAWHSSISRSTITAMCGRSWPLVSVGRASATTKWRPYSKLPKAKCSAVRLEFRLWITKYVDEHDVAALLVEIDSFRRDPNLPHYGLEAAVVCVPKSVGEVRHQLELNCARRKRYTHAAAVSIARNLSERSGLPWPIGPKLIGDPSISVWPTLNRYSPSEIS